METPTTLKHLRMAGKCAIVTGGSKGIGAGIGITIYLLFTVKEFIKEGCYVVFCCRKIEEGKKFVYVVDL